MRPLNNGEDEGKQLAQLEGVRVAQPGVKTNLSRYWVSPFLDQKKIKGGDQENEHEQYPLVKSPKGIKEGAPRGLRETYK